MKRIMIKTSAVVMTALMIMSMLAGCGGKSETEKNGEKVLNFGAQLYSDGTVDPTYDINGAWNVVRFGVGETLFRFSDSMEVEPWLAEKYETEDNKTWVITLKEGIKFSDGCDMTASKVAASMQNMLDKGPDGAATPEKYVPYETKITADDEANTLTLELPDENCNLPGNLAYPVCVIVDVDHTDDWTNGVIGTGPYKISDFREQVGYTVVRNDNYYADVPYDTVNIKFMGDASAKAMALRSGEVDVTENITNVADIQEFQDDPAFTVDIAQSVRCGFVWMNMSRKPLDNKELRKAIVMAIDHDAICNSKTIGGLYTPGFSVLPSTLSFGYDKLTESYPYDPEEAEKVLDEAGIRDTDGDGWRELDGEMIDLKFVSYENRLLNDLSDAYAIALKNIGIKVTADYGSSDDQWTKLTTLEYDLNNNSWNTVGNGDPTDYMANWYSKSEADYCGYQNEEYDALYEELLKKADKEKRADILQKMQQILIDDAACIIDGYYNSSMICSEKVVGAHISTADFYWITADIKPAE